MLHSIGEIDDEGVNSFTGERHQEVRAIQAGNRGCLLLRNDPARVPVDGCRET
jgi:hypothetical protein